MTFSGLAMIKTTESSPPPTDLAFEEAVQLLHKLERKLRLEVESDLRDLRLQMTAKKIDFVSRKAQRLYTIRQQLGSCRVLCKQVTITLPFNKHGRKFICYSYICFYSLFSCFQQIPSRSNITHKLAFVFKNQS